MNFDFVNFITIPEPRIGQANLSPIIQFRDDLKVLLIEQFANRTITAVHSKLELTRPGSSPNFPPNVKSTFGNFVKEAEAADFRLRDSMAWATPIGHPFAIRHPEAMSAREMFKLNWLAAAAWESDTATQIWRYVLCLWCHIFVDGNGRLARRFLSAVIYHIDLENRVDFRLCLQIAENIHIDIKDQLVIMESQNFCCWLAGTFELLSESASKMSMNGGFLND